MNRPLVSSLLFASMSIASVLATTALAGPGQAASTTTAIDATAQVEAGAQPDVGNDADTNPQVERNCLAQTGTRIVVSRPARSAAQRNDKAGPRCVGANGRVYSREDIERTGEVDLAGALRKLDPSIH